MVLRIGLICFFLVAYSFAETISYTAYSKESQTHADQEAIAGVAKQISSKIEATTEVRRSEIQKGDESTLQKSIKTHNSVETDLALKWVRVVQGKKKDGVYSATASINLDEVLAPIQRKMQKIQQEISKKEAKILALLEKNNFKDIPKLINEISVQIKKHEALIPEYELYKVLPKNLEITSNLQSITEKFKNKLGYIEFLLPKEDSIVINKNFMTFKVRVNIENTPVSNFSFYAEQQGKILFDATSDKNGVVSFKIPLKMLKKKPNSLFIIPKLALRFNDIPSLEKKELFFNYNVESCNLELKCLEEPYICNEISKSLSENLGFNVKVSTTASLQSKIRVESKRSLQQLSSYAVTLEFQKDDFYCSISKTGVGKSENEAIQSAIQKMNFESCDSLSKWCKP